MASIVKLYSMLQIFFRQQNMKKFYEISLEWRLLQMRLQELIMIVDLGCETNLNPKAKVGMEVAFV